MVIDFNDTRLGFDGPQLMGGCLALSTVNGIKCQSLMGPWNTNHYEAIHPPPTMWALLLILGW